MRRVLGGIGVGIGGAALGLLPWLVTGARLPLQNLADVAPDRMPLALLPFSQYAVVLIPALLITGSAAAGLAARLLAARVHRGVVVTALLVVQLVAVGQTTVATADVLERSTPASLYLAVLVADALLSVVVGLVAHLLLSLAPKGGALLGIALAAVPLQSWLGGLLVPFGSFSVAGDPRAALLPLLRWVPAVVLGLGIGWCGLRTVWRVLAAVAGLGILWVGPAAVTAVVNTAGSRVLLRDPEALVENTQAIFGAAATTAELVVPPLVLAVVLGAAGIGVAAAMRRRRPPAGSG